MLLRSSLWKAALLQEHLLNQIPFLSMLPEAQLSMLMGKLSVASWAAPSVLFHAGEPSNRLYLVLHGQIELVQALGTSDERLLCVRGAGEFINRTCLLGGDLTYVASARVQQDAQLLALSCTDLELFSCHAPQLAGYLKRAIGEQLTCLPKAE